MPTPEMSISGRLGGSAAPRMVSSSSKGDDMDRREALQKMAIGGVTIVGASAVLSSTAFADGGSKPACRPVPNAAKTLVASVAGSGKNWIKITPTPDGVFPVVPCPPGCAGGTATVQYRYELFATVSGVALYTTPTGGTALTSAFSPASTTSVTAPVVYIRKTAGGNLDSGTYTTRLTVRYICTVGARTYYSCRSYEVVAVYASGTGSDGDVSSTTSTIGPPVNTSSCDSPAP